MSVNEKMTAIADNIRKYTGGGELLTLDGVAAAVEEVFEAGGRSEYDTLWENLQQKGRRLHYDSAFCYSGWNDKIYNPKYPITPTSTIGISSIFRWNQEITDTKVPITAYGSAQNAFANAAVKRIPKLIFSGTTNTTNMFSSATALEELNCEGELTLSINLQWSTKLTKASITSVVNVLSATTTGQSVTFSKNAVNTAFETDTGAADGSTSAEWTALANTKSNWTINLV